MLTGSDVLKDFGKKIKLSSFTRTETIKESPRFEQTVENILRMRGAHLDKCFLNTTTERSHLDICKEIIGCDYVWFDKNGGTVAFWEQKTKTLHY